MPEPEPKKLENKTKPLEAPILTDAERRKIEESLPRVRADVDRFNEKLTQFERNHPQAFQRMSEKHPKIIGQIETLKRWCEKYGAQNETLSNESLIAIADDYNDAARSVNLVLRQTERDEAEKAEQILGVGLEFADEIAQKLTESEMKLIKKFAKDLWNELFPESNVSQFVRWAGNQKELEDSQRILIAPAEGIEMVVSGMINLLQTKTYRDLNSAVQTAYGMSYQDWCDSLQFMKFTYDQLETTDKVAPAISLIYGLTFLTGGVGKIGQVLKKMDAPPVIQKLIIGAAALRGTATLSHGINVLPAAVIGEMTLPYIGESD